MYGIWILIEPIRLRAGFSGNLKERVSQLSGLFLFSLFPQLVVAFYFIFLQPYTGSGFAFPIEVALNIVYLLLIFPEIIYSYLSARRVINHQVNSDLD